MKRNMVMSIFTITCLLALNGCSKSPTEQASIKEEAVVEENIIAEAVVEDGKKVKLHYVMKVDGNIIMDTHQGEPAEIAFGTDRILRGIQTGIEGLKAGDQKQLTLAPEYAFGFVKPENIIEFQKKQVLGEDPEQQAEPVDLKVGMVLDSQDQNGKRLRAVITEVREETVFLDFNHPLAGKELQFDVEILEVM